MEIEVIEHTTSSGANPYRQWLSQLSIQHAAKVMRAVARLQGGNTSAIKWFDGIGEIRIDWGPGLRVYLARQGRQLVILFGGGDKSTQERDIEAAKAYLAEVKANKKLQPEKKP